MISDRPSTLVCSIGGVGSTMLLRFLADLPACQVNPPTGFVNPLKHPPRPPRLSSVERALFLFGCPCDSLLSLFRRGNDRLHYANVKRLFPPGFDYPDRDAWQETCARFGLAPSERSSVWVDAEGRYASDIGAIDWYRERSANRAEQIVQAQEWLERVTRPAYADFDDFLQRGEDSFGRERQFDHWRADPEVDYPILLVRYESLWQHLDAVLDFLTVPRRYRAGFPAERRRRSNWRGLDPRRRTQLEGIYGSLQNKVRAEADVRLLGGSA